MAIRLFSIHGHFYQPPREDPLTGIIPKEAGASPYTNWNERIHAECYRPNAQLRNFEQISFNVGPTLCTWMASHDHETCRNIVEQDINNIRRFGVGNAMAQAYNHTILPLSSFREKMTQIAWGVADFQYRFGRKPQGMWLPETAADQETLEALALNGIEFTILAPWQAEVDAVDPTEPYRVALSGGKEITVFFYQRDLSARVSFDASATENADLFVQNILQSFYYPTKERRGEPQMLLVASDGELYGHHKLFRDRFLARLVDGASSLAGVQPIYPGLWLKNFPAQRLIKIRDQTSWSCHHGVERWKGICGCTPGDASWKPYLRSAFDRIASEIDAAYLDVVSAHVDDPWKLRNLYIQVILGEMTVEELIRESASGSLTSQEVQHIHLMLEAQRERQRMFTSCGWFFEDFDRIEPRNNVAYAAQAVRLVRMATGVDLEGFAIEDLKSVVSQRTHISAASIFERHLRRAEGINRVKIGFAD